MWIAAQPLFICVILAKLMGKLSFLTLIMEITHSCVVERFLFMTVWWFVVFYCFVTVCLSCPDIQECSLQPGPILCELSLCEFEIGQYKNTNKVLMHAQSMEYNKFYFTFFPLGNIALNYASFELCNVFKSSFLANQCDWVSTICQMSDKIYIKCLIQSFNSTMTLESLGTTLI